MSDTNSAHTPLSGSIRCLRQFLRRYHESSPTGDPARDRQDFRLQAEAERSLAQLEELATTSSHSRQTRAPPVGAMTTPLTSGDNTAAAPIPGQRGPRKPVTTLVSMLPKTTYNEADEAEGTVRTPPYIRVQRQLLHYLGIHASDTLTPRQALRWTEDTADNKRPQAKDALRLCYYMRSQGFDTYAAFRDGFMSLYIANQNTDVKGPGPDLLYWKQNFKNNAIAHEVTTQSGSNGARGPRRNAFASADVTTQELLAHLSAIGTASNRAQFANNLAVAAHDGHGEDAGGNVGPVLENNEGQEDEDGQTTQGSLEARIAAATADLETLLLSNSPDTAAIDAAIARVAELNSQGN